MKTRPIYLLSILLLTAFVIQPTVQATPASPPSPARETAPTSASGFWQCMNPIPGECNFLDVWGTAANNVFAIGEEGIIAHYDGTEWIWMHNPKGGDLNGIWGTAGINIYAVGELGTILHYDGSTWAGITRVTDHTLNAIWGTGENDIFVVGNGSVILHFDGIGWTIMPVPPDLDEEDHLWGVWGTSHNDVFAVGRYGIILHFNGSAWSEMESNTSNRLYGVWGSASDNVYAAGWSGEITRYNGSEWTSLGVGGATNYYDVWGSSATDVFVGGFGGTIRHYDGSLWTDMTVPSIDAVMGVWGISSSAVFVAGWNILWRYNGSTWTALHSGSSGNYIEVWANAADDIFAVGSDGAIGHFDGVRWSTMTSGTTDYLYDVWGTSASNVYAVGGYMASLLLHYNGSAWAPEFFPPGGGINGIFGYTASDLYALSDDVYHFSGSEWTALGLGGFADIWGSPTGNIYLVGGCSILQGPSWDAMPNPCSGGNLTGVWGTSTTNVYAVGNDPYSSPGILHYEGENWVQEQTGIYNDVWGLSASDVFATGGSNYIVHFDGTTWGTVPSTTPTILNGISGSPEAGLYAVGAGSTVVQYRIPEPPEPLVPPDDTRYQTFLPVIKK